MTLPIQMRCSGIDEEPARDREEVEDERKRSAAAWTIIAVQWLEEKGEEGLMESRGMEGWRDEGENGGRESSSRRCPRLSPLARQTCSRTEISRAARSLFASPERSSFASNWIALRSSFTRTQEPTVHGILFGSHNLPKPLLFAGQNQETQSS